MGCQGKTHEALAASQREELCSGHTHNSQIKVGSWYPCKSNQNDEISICSHRRARENFCTHDHHHHHHLWKWRISAGNQHEANRSITALSCNVPHWLVACAVLIKSGWDRNTQTEDEEEEGSEASSPQNNSAMRGWCFLLGATRCAEALRWWAAPLVQKAQQKPKGLFQCRSI